MDAVLLRLAPLARVAVVVVGAALGQVRIAHPCEAARAQRSANDLSALPRQRLVRALLLVDAWKNAERDTLGIGGDVRRHARATSERTPRARARGDGARR